MLGGSGGGLPPEKMDKNGVIWCNLDVPKYVIRNLKINNFNDKSATTTKLNCHIFLLDQSRCLSIVLIPHGGRQADLHVSMKIHLEFTRGVWGVAPRSRRNFLKI